MYNEEQLRYDFYNSNNNYKTKKYKYIDFEIFIKKLKKW
jgi:hypothetical protein